MSDIIDINVNKTVEEVTINVVDNLITVNINNVTGGGGGSQTLAQTLDLGNTTGGENISISNGDAIILDNGSMLKKGTIDAGNGGSKGISQICSVGFEHKWEAGRLYIMNDGGTAIREVSHNLTYTPTVTDDVTKGFLENSRWILDNGDVYVCIDSTEGEAVWEFITGAVPTLQQVTDEGNNETTNDIIVKDSENKISLRPRSIDFQDLDDGGNTLLSFEQTSVLNQEVIIRGLSGTMALTSDIPTNTSDLTNDGADGVNPYITALDIPTAGVTSVDLTMPSAFTVSGNPVTSSGTLAVTAAGVASQYIRGDGTLATLPTSASGGSSISYYLNGGTAASVATYYQMSKTAVVGTGVDFSKAGNGLISQWLTDVADPNRLEITAGNWNFEMYMSASSLGGPPAFYVELLKYDGTTFTTISNSSAVPEAITGGTSIDLYLTSLAIPQTTLLVTDRLAIRVYIVNSTGGRTITMHTQDSHLCQIITNFAGGVTSLNGLTTNTQYFDEGTTGTDFNISSITDTHTFNLPTASASNRGALSSADWSTFNGKQAALSYTPYKFIQTGITAHTGTVAETIIATATIAGGTFNTSDVMKVMFGANKSSTATACTQRIKINTSNTLTGAVTLAGLNSTTANAIILKRNFVLNNGNLYGVQFSLTNTVTDEAVVLTSTYNNTPFNTANTLYLFFTVQLGNVADSVIPNLFNITN